MKFDIDKLTNSSDQEHKSEHKPEEFMLNPTMSNFILLDKVSRNLTTLVKSQELHLKNQELQQLNQKSLDSKFDKLIDLEIKNNELLSSILKEQKEGADDGEVMHLDGTANTTAFTIVNTLTDPGHAVKAFELINDGANSIYVGYNVVPSSEGADIIDVNSSISRFDEVTTTESISYRFNRNKIRNIYLLASGGNSAYRLKLIW